MLADLITQTKACSKCKVTFDLSTFSKNKSSKDGFNSHCKSCSKARGKDYYCSNTERETQRKKTYRLENTSYVKQLESKYRERNRNRIRSGYRSWYSKNALKINNINSLWRKVNSEKTRIYSQDWRDKNRGLYRSYLAKRRAKKLSATPRWTSKMHSDHIKSIYKKANLLEIKDGIKREVDHIHPLNNKYICGLELPCNLQILTTCENRSKSNKFIPYVESELDPNNLLPWQCFYPVQPSVYIELLEAA